MITDQFSQGTGPFLFSWLLATVVAGYIKNHDGQVLGVARPCGAKFHTFSRLDVNSLFSLRWDTGKRRYDADSLA